MKEIKLQRIIISFIAVFVLSIISLSAVQAEVVDETVMIEEESAPLLGDFPLEITGDVGIHSKYIWRGFELDSKPVMQSDVNVSLYWFTISAWGSFGIDRGTDSADEVDYTIDFSYDFEMVSFSAGHIFYIFPTADGESKEFYIGASLNVLLSPSLTWYHDYDEGDGDYIVLSLSHGFEFDNGITIDLGLSAGYNNELWIEGKGGDVTATAGVSIPLTDTCSVSPYIAISVPLGDLEDDADGAQDTNFFGGVNVAFGF